MLAKRTDFLKGALRGYLKGARCARTLNGPPAGFS